jgi:hypothetical protein
VCARVVCIGEAKRCLCEMAFPKLVKPVKASAFFTLSYAIIGLIEAVGNSVYSLCAKPSALAVAVYPEMQARFMSLQQRRRIVYRQGNRGAAQIVFWPIKPIVDEIAKSIDKSQWAQGSHVGVMRRRTERPFQLNGGCVSLRHIF